MVAHVHSRGGAPIRDADEARDRSRPPAPAVGLAPRWERAVRVRHDVPVSELVPLADLREAFDLAAIDRATGLPRLVVDLLAAADPTRRRRLDACRAARLPYLIVAYESAADRPGRSGRTALVQCALDEILGPPPLPDRRLGSRDPMARRARDFRHRLPGPVGDRRCGLFSRGGWNAARFEITGAVSIGPQGVRSQTLVQTVVRLLGVDALRGRGDRLLDSIGREALYRKAFREIGADPEAWRRRLRAAPWTTR